MKHHLLILALIIPLFVNAQKAPFKFGKVSDDELKMSSCSFYPEAESMIIGKLGSIKFRYSKENGFQYQYEVIVRKKIFKISGKDEGNVSIKIYNPVAGSADESLSGVNGFTYNLVDGKVVKTKLKNENEFDTRINDYWVKKSFALPDVQAGSVIEYTYTKTSDFLSNLDTWYFQEDIPVGFSELQATLPEYFHYQVNQEGSYVNVQSVSETVQEAFDYMARIAGTPTTLSSNGTPPRTEKRTFTSTSIYRRFTATDILPIIDEPFMNNKENIPARVKFQLMTIHFPGSPIEQIAGSYEKLNTTLMERETFGKTFNNGNFSKDKVEELADLDDMGKAQSLYYWLRDNITWNKLNSISSENVGRKTFNEKEGSVSDINLTLVATLREAGLDASPVILSTRGNGILHPVFPNFQDFNYVIGSVIIGDQLILLDAASDMPFGLLPQKCLNGKGWLVNNDGGQWVNLKEDALFFNSINIATEFDPGDGGIISTIKCDHRNHSAINTISTYNRLGQEEFEQDLSKSLTDWKLSNLEMKSSNKSDTVEMTFEIAQSFENEDIVYLQPLPHGTITENPFVREERISPVDFPYQRRNIVMARIVIPDNYVVELPKAAIVKLPENAATFKYVATQLGNSVTVMSDFALNKQDFNIQEYPYIKQFYQLMAEKNGEVIVLKRSQ